MVVKREAVKKLAQFNYLGGGRGCPNHIDTEVNIEREYHLLADQSGFLSLILCRPLRSQLAYQTALTLLLLVIGAPENVDKATRILPRLLLTFFPLLDDLLHPFGLLQTL